MNAPRYRVTATALNLRSSPSAENRSNLIATLPNGHPVEKLAEANPRWWEVRARFRGKELEGFVGGKFLKPEAEFAAPREVREVQEVHLSEDRPSVRRDRDGGRAHPLGEPGRPARKATSAAGKRRDLGRIIDWLAVERSARYQAKSNATYCNVYAHDYCYLAGVYLPRVWWTGPGLTRLAAGEPVTPVYGDTLRELNANALYEWLDEFGPSFGWERVFDVEEVQATANKGGVGLICAQRVNLNRSGHIVAVIAEDDRHGARRGDGSVVCPVQSQAGTRNFRRETTRTRWWQDARFREFGIWRHE